MRTRLLAAALALVVCGEARALSGGSVERGHREVVFVRTQRMLCSGTLIAPDVVLTAAHCVTAAKNALDVRVGVGRATTQAARPRLAQVADDVNHRAYTVKDQALMRTWPCYAGGCKGNAINDVGLLQLAEPIAGVTPASFGAAGGGAPPRRCSVVGFGTHYNDDGDALVGEKRSGTVVLAASGTNAFEPAGNSPVIPEHGDSGGPLLCHGRVLAVVSGESSDAHGLHVQLSRLDGSLVWIRQQISDWAKGKSAVRHR
jgi:hypothetical protein